MTSKTLHSPATDGSTRGLVAELTKAIHDLQNRRLSRIDFTQVRKSLDAISLTCEEFALARNRLKNAERYCQREEFGASRWALRALLRQLAN